MSMNKASREALDKALGDLVNDLQLEPALKYLQDEKIMGRDLVKEIRKQRDESQKRRQFLENLKTCGQKAYDTFRSYLLATPGQKHLGELLPEDMSLEAQWTVFENKFGNLHCQHNSMDLYDGLPDTIYLLLVGKTGSGKSATGNTILNERLFHTSISSQSCTKMIEQRVCKIGTREVRIIDTPGLFDTEMQLSNEDILLNVVNTLIQFENGIHLFLLVMNFTRFTKEEERTLNAVEKALSDNIYPHCVIIFTHSKGRFGGKDSPTLREFIEHEKGLDGVFSKLLAKVKDRVIAVENSFDEVFLQQRHRQKLLTCLAQIIASNKNSIYSNNLFVRAHAMIENEIKEREKRYEQNEIDFEVATALEIHLLKSVLPYLNVKDLKDLADYFMNNASSILDGANLSSAHPKDKTVRGVFKTFPTTYQRLIQIYIDIIHEQSFLILEIQGRMKKIEDAHSLFEIREKVIDITVPYFVGCDREKLQKMINESLLPIDLMKEVRTCLSNLPYDDKSIRRAVTDEMRYQSGFQSSIDTRPFVNQTRETLFRELASCNDSKVEQVAILEQLTGFSLIIRSLPEDKIDSLCRIFKDGITHMLVTTVTDYILQSVLDTPATTEAIKYFFTKEVQTLSFLMVETLSIERDTEAKLNEQLQRFKNTNQALRKVGHIIDSNLKNYLSTKTKTELKQIDKEINDGKVPPQIRGLVMGEISSLEEAYDEDIIQKEILVQLKEKRQTIESILKEAKCFPGSSLVFTKEGRQKMSTIKVGDEILVYNYNGELSYEKVFLLSHSNSNSKSLYICLTTEGGRELLISPEHLLPINNLQVNVPAMKASVGDILFCDCNGRLSPEKIKSVSFEICKGAYAPITVGGCLIVNGIAASCYTNFVNPKLAKALLLPIRYMFQWLPQSVFSLWMPYDKEEGMPVILAKCRLAIICLRNLKTRCERFAHSLFF